MRKRISTKTSALFFLICALCGAGAVPVFLRYLFKSPELGGLGLDIWVINALRYAMAPLFWLPFVLAKGSHIIATGNAPADAVVETDGNRIWRDALLPACFSIVNQAAWGGVGKYADANTIAFASKLAFPVAILYCFIFFPEERLLARSRLFWLGVAGCFAGLALLSVERLAFSSLLGTSLMGLILLLLIAVSWGGYSVSVRLKMPNYSAISSFWVISVYTTIGLTLLMWAFGDVAIVTGLDMTTWGIVIASSLVGITFWHVLYYKAIRGLGTIVADGVLMSSPAITIVGSAWILGEHMTVLQAIGGSIIAGGSILLVVVRGRCN
jgi:drug/metabolite transporter (DMT)-like permease